MKVYSACICFLHKSERGGWTEGEQREVMGGGGGEGGENREKERGGRDWPDQAGAVVYSSHSVQQCGARLKDLHLHSESQEHEKS